MELSDFGSNPGPKTTLDLFGTSKSVPQSFIPEDTAVNVAAHAALLDDPANVMATYNNINTELSTGSTVTLDELLQRRSEIDHQATYDELQRIFADPNISIEDKTRYMDGYIGMSIDHPGHHSLGVLVAQQAAMSPGAPDENDETVRTMLPSGSLEDVDEYNGWVQKQIDAVSNSSNRNWLSNTIDVLEMMVPFSDQLGTLKTENEAGLINNAGDVIKGLTLLGENKKATRDSISRMPIAQQYDLARKVLEAVKTTGGSVTTRPNVLSQINQMTSLLDNGGYNTNGRLVDDIFSIMDATILLGPLKTLFKGGKAAATGVLAARRAAAVEARAVEETTQDVTEILDSTKSGDTIFVNSDGAASTNLNKVQQTKLEGGAPIIVDSKGGAFVSGENGISDELLASVQKQIAESVAAKFRKPMELKTPKSDDMGTMVDDIGADVTYEALDDELLKSVQSVLNKHNLADPETVKKLNKVLQETLERQRIITPKKTFNATATQLVNKVLVESNVARLSARTSVGQTSVSQVMKHVNPAKARVAHQMMVEDTTGKAAKTLYGTTREEAIANDLLPEIGNVDNSVRNKIVIDEALPHPDQEIVKGFKENKGRKDLSPEEKASTRAVVRRDWRDVVGLEPRTAMATVGAGRASKKLGSVMEDTSTGVSFDMVYGPKDGGFLTPKAAIESVLFALKKYGVKDSEVEVLARTATGDYAPIGKTLETKEGSYLVRVKHDYEFSPGDTVHATLSNSKWSMFDSWQSWTSGKMGGLLQHFVPSSAIVNNVLFSSASVAADRSAWYGKKLIDLATSYSQKFKKLDKRQQAMVDAYRLEANERGLKFNTVNLEARGFSPEAIDTLRDWRRTTDTIWYLENIDANKSARALGWFKFVDRTSDTDLMVKPLPNRGVATTGGAEVYDSAAGKIITLTKKEVDDLYESGGFIAQTRGTVKMGDDPEWDYILVQNKSESSYVRAIRDDDNTLTYRDGYYPIKYADPYFIRQTFKTKKGTYTKAIATAGSLSDAKRFTERLLMDDESIGAADLNITHDKKIGSQDYEEDMWQSLVSTGRSAQRVRGEKLADTKRVIDPAHQNIQSPEESLVNSIQSVAARTAYRDWIDNSKQRWMKQFGHLIEKKDGWQAAWPTDVRMIGADMLQESSMSIADAKAGWRYIHAMEAGYVNLLDDVSKNFFKGMSTLGGQKGWQWLEKAGNAGAKLSPTAWARKKAFRFLLAANPLRQAPVQAMQAVPILLATNPLAIPKIAFQNIFLNYMKTGGDADSFMKIMAQKVTGLDLVGAKQLAKHYEMSGFEAAVDANSLIRDQIATLVDRSLLGKVKRVASAPLNFGQKIGFNAGENMLMRTVWLSEYDLLRQSGKKIDMEALETLNARVRALTLDMNKAGELPYNENMFSAALQFFQAPHKAFSQIVFGHTGLSGLDRAKLGAAYITTYGLGVSWLSDFIMKGFSNDPNTREIVEGGVFNLALNATLSSIYGKEVKTDFSDSLRLLQVPPVFEFWNGLMSMQMGEFLSHGASMGLVIGDNARVSNFVKQMMRPFVSPPDRAPAEALQAGKAFLEIFSGASSMFKAIYAMKMHQTINTKGGIIDYNVNDMEAFMKAAGFSTIDEVHRYASNEETYLASQKFKDDIAYVIDETSRRLAREGISTEEGDWLLRQISEAHLVWGDNPVYMKAFIEQVRYKASTGEHTLFKYLLDGAGYIDPSQFDKLVKGSHLTDKEKDTLLKFKTLFEEGLNNG